MKVFCDNYDCMFIDEDGFCDCDKLNIVGGVCVGSYHGGRNATENDADERLKAETKALQELVQDMWDWLAPYATANGVALTRLHERMSELIRD